jgi:Zn-dependent peptidase ImmA (M78 family)/DNA-binding XRE family transcriptional regulator
VAEAMINPEILEWARRRAALSVEDVAKRLAIAKPERVMRWEQGEERPTFNQARRLAAILRVPFGYLFLRAVPSENEPLPDLRTIGRRRAAFSQELVQVYRDALRKQAWMREHRERHDDEPLGFVGSARGVTDPAIGAGAIRQTLNLTPSLLQSVASWEQYFTALVDRAEAAGVLVLRSSTVGADTHRKLDVDEFRGFAIADEYAPLVFVNAGDAKSAQIFTLIHELAHIWRAETGISRPDIEKADDDGTLDVEAFCDAVAAEVLVPANELLALWNEDESLAEACERLAKVFRVSQLVVARRAFDLGRTTRRDFDELVGVLFARARASKQKQQEAEGGPGFLPMVRLRSSKTLTSAIVEAVRAGDVLYREAASLLGVKPAHIDQLANAMGAR